jgi:hypothetical protein
VSNERTTVSRMAQPRGSRSHAATPSEPSAASAHELPIRITAGRGRHCYASRLTCALNQAGRWLHLGYRKELDKIVGKPDLLPRSGRRSSWPVVSP